ncbi:hypothetical protein HB364_21955 [Pseudoflavitalea sp. X16]|uniref:hypothetical protein n=1 Tax=Paraflavitalea devenefica TaxID=2716334 RepID=UPI001420FA50|nr:hypothetical protein [Paraflavitalea devenefica]NII27763.1 hypothetical protein [Paraflavitalea devenefica]
MKKVRFMLLAIAVIAIAGGTLAFKAKFSEDICTGDALALGGGVFTCKIQNHPVLPDQTATCEDIDAYELVPDNEQTIPVCTTEVEACEEDNTFCALTTLDLIED